MSEEPSWLPLLQAVETYEPDLWRAYREAVRLPSRRLVGRFALYRSDGPQGAAPVLPHRSPHEIALERLVASLHRRLRRGDLTARGRQGSPLAPVTIIPPDAWQYLKLILGKSAARMADGSTVYSVELSYMSVPTKCAGGNAWEQEKSNEINDVPTDPTVPTEKHKGQRAIGVPPIGSPPNSDVSAEEIGTYLDRVYGASDAVPGRDALWSAIRLHFAGRHVDAALFRRLHKGRRQRGRPRGRSTAATVQRRGEP